MPDPIIFPTTFNDDNNVVALFNVVLPDTFNDDINVVLLFRVVVNDTFNDDNNVDKPETYKLLKLVLLFINDIEFVDKLFKLLNKTPVSYYIT